jgi:ethanolamine utilization microcompartment shell protein EutL
MSTRSLARSLVRAGTETGQAAADSAATIAARLPILAGAIISPTAEGMAEWNRAYAEKVAAAWTGFFAASAAWQEVMIRAAFRPPSPTAFANDVVRVSHKAGHAARKAVKANAKRLGRAR